MLTWTMVSYPRHYFTSELVVDGIRKGIVISDNDDNDFTPATAIIVLQLNAGQHVYVRGVSNSDCNVISNNEHARSTFSAWLLFST